MLVFTFDENGPSFVGNADVVTPELLKNPVPSNLPPRTHKVEQVCVHGVRMVEGVAIVDDENPEMFAVLSTNELAECEMEASFSDKAEAVMFGSLLAQDFNLSVHVGPHE